MGSSIKIKHADGITILHVDSPTRIVCTKGEIEYVEKPWKQHGRLLVTKYGYKQTFKFKGV